MAPLLLLAALTGCDRFTGSEGDIEAIAYDAASDATGGKFSDMESKLADLDSRVGELERDNRLLKANLDELRDRESRLTDAIIKDLAGIQEDAGRFRDAYNRHTH